MLFYIPDLGNSIGNGSNIKALEVEVEVFSLERRLSISRSRGRHPRTFDPAMKTVCRFSMTIDRIATFDLGALGVFRRLKYSEKGIH